MAAAQADQLLTLKKLLTKRAYPKAERLARRLQMKMPRSPELLLTRHEIAAALGKRSEAEAVLTQLLAVAPRARSTKLAEARFVGRFGAAARAVSVLSDVLKDGDDPG